MNDVDSLYIIEKSKKINLSYQDDLTSCLAFFDDETRCLFSIYENDKCNSIVYCGITLLDEGCYKFNLEYFMIDDSKQCYLYSALKEILSRAFNNQLLVLENDPYFNYKYVKECLVVRIIKVDVPSKTKLKIN